MNTINAMLQSPDLFPWISSSCFMDPKTNLVTHRASGDTYLAASHHPPRVLRCTLCTLSIAALFWIPLVRIPARIFGLCTGDFIAAGHDRAKRTWELLMQGHSQDWVNNPITPTKARNLFYTELAKEVLLQLAKNIVKLILQPLTAIACVFAALYGLLKPWDGMAKFAAIEGALSRDASLASTRNLAPNLNFHISSGEYLAACMQPEARWIEANLYRTRTDPDYNPCSLRSRLRHLSLYLKQNEAFFQAELPKPTREQLHACIQQYRDHIRMFSVRDMDEFPQTDAIPAIALQLEIITQSLENLKLWRMERFKTQLHPEKPPSGFFNNRVIILRELQEALDPLNTTYMNRLNHLCTQVQALLQQNQPLMDRDRQPDGLIECLQGYINRPAPIQEAQRKERITLNLNTLLHAHAKWRFNLENPAHRMYHGDAMLAAARNLQFDYAALKPQWDLIRKNESNEKRRVLLRDASATDSKDTIRVA